MYYYTSTLANYFEAGNTFPATITNAAAGYFNIENELIAHIVEECRSTTEPDDYVQSLLIDKREGHQY
jgi:hypothetical protein